MDVCPICSSIPGTANLAPPDYRQGLCATDSGGLSNQHGPYVQEEFRNNHSKLETLTENLPLYFHRVAIEATRPGITCRRLNARRRTNTVSASGSDPRDDGHRLSIRARCSTASKGALARSAAEPPLTPSARRAGRAHLCDGRGAIEAIRSVPVIGARNHQGRIYRQ